MRGDGVGISWSSTVPDYIFMREADNEGDETDNEGDEVSCGACTSAIRCASGLANSAPSCLLLARLVPSRADPRALMTETNMCSIHANQLRVPCPT